MRIVKPGQRHATPSPSVDQAADAPANASPAPSAAAPAPDTPPADAFHAASRGGNARARREPIAPPGPDSASSVEGMRPVETRLRARSLKIRASQGDDLLRATDRRLHDDQAPRVELNHLATALGAEADETGDETHQREVSVASDAVRATGRGGIGLDSGSLSGDVAFGEEDESGGLYADLTGRLDATERGVKTTVAAGFRSTRKEADGSEGELAGRGRLRLDEAGRWKVDGNVQGRSAGADHGTDGRLRGSFDENGARLDGLISHDVHRDGATIRNRLVGKLDLGDGTLSTEGTRHRMDEEGETLIAGTGNAAVTEDGITADAQGEFHRVRAREDGRQVSVEGTGRAAWTGDGADVDAEVLRRSESDTALHETGVRATWNDGERRIAGNWGYVRGVDEARRETHVDGRLDLQNGVVGVGARHVVGEDGNTQSLSGGAAELHLRSGGYQIHTSGEVRRKAVRDDGSAWDAGATGRLSVDSDGPFEVGATIDGTRSRLDGTSTGRAGVVVNDRSVEVEAGAEHRTRVGAEDRETRLRGRGDLGRGQVEVGLRHERADDDGALGGGVDLQFLDANVRARAKVEREIKTGTGSTTWRGETDWDGAHGDVEVAVSRTTRERSVANDGTARDDETTYGARVGLKERKAEVEYQTAHLEEKDNLQRSQTARAILGTQGVSYSRTRRTLNQNTQRGESWSSDVKLDGERLTVAGERVATDKARADEDPFTFTETGYRGSVEVKVDGMSATLEQKREDEVKGSQNLQGTLSVGSEGIALHAAGGHADSEGNGSQLEGGLEIGTERAGVSFGRSTSRSVSERVAESRSRRFEALLGERETSFGVESSRSRAVIGNDDKVTTRSTFGRLSGRVEAYQQATDLGPVRSKHPAVAGKHRIELQRVMNVEGGGAAGVLVGALGLHGGLSVAKGSNIRHRTHVSPERAQELAASYEGKGVSALALRNMNAVSLLDQKVALPDLKDPDALAVFDEVKVSTSGSLRAHVGASGFGAKLGGQVTLGGEFFLELKKTSDSTIELTVTPTELRGIEGSAGFLLLQGSVEKIRAESLTQKFSFDLSSDTGRAAYLKALDGELPGTLTPDQIDAREDALGKLTQRDLPRGVERLRIEKVEAHEHEVSVGAGWLFLTASRAKAVKRTDHVVTDGAVSINHATRGVEHRRKTFLSGDESEGVSATLRVVTTYDEQGTKVSAFDSLTLTASFADDKVKGDETDEEVIAKLNRYLDANLAPFGSDGNKEQREVTASLRFAPEDLAALAAADDASVRAEAARFSLDERDCLTLRGALSSTQDAQERARLVMAFVEEQGLAGLGWLKRLALAETPAELKTESSAYDRPIAAAKRLASRYGEPAFTGEMSKAEITDRFEALQEVSEQIEAGFARAETDSVMSTDPEAQNDLVTALQQAREQVGRLLDFSSLAAEEARRMYDKLDWGWTTSAQYAAMEKIVQDTGITV